MAPRPRPGQPASPRLPALPAPAVRGAPSLPSCCKGPKLCLHPNACHDVLQRSTEPGSSYIPHRVPSASISLRLLYTYPALGLRADECRELTELLAPEGKLSQTDPPRRRAKRQAACIPLSKPYGLITIFIDVACGCEARSIAATACSSPNRCEISRVRSKLPSR